MKTSLHNSMTASLFASALADTATYVGRDGVENSISVIYAETENDVFGTGEIGVNDAQISFRIQVADVNEPQAGDVIWYGGHRYTVDQAPERIDRNVWRVNVTY